MHTKIPLEVRQIFYFLSLQNNEDFFVRLRIFTFPFTAKRYVSQRTYKI